MAHTYPCKICDKVFTKAYELKKHNADHADPCNVLHCPRCDFISFQKKNLAIHFKNHIGEKDKECPDMINPEQPCDFKTHDPAALTKHRKRVHGYVPSARNRRKEVSVAPVQTERETNDKVPRCRKPAQPDTSSLRRSPRKARNPDSNASGSTTLPFGNLNEATTAYGPDFGYDVGNGTLIGTDDEIGLDTLFDPSLRSQWMAQFERSYSTFDMTGIKNQLETIPAVAPTNLRGQTSKEGYLCPEWI